MPISANQGSGTIIRGTIARQGLVGSARVYIEFISHPNAVQSKVLQKKSEEQKGKVESPGK